MSIRNNLLYSALLTLSTYLVPLLVFPHISRVLGVENIGAIDTIDNIIDYCILFSMMGMSTLGIREIAKNKDNPKSLQITFSSLFSLNIISTTIVFILLIIATLLLPDMQQRLTLLMVGTIKLLANLFWIEWLYRGIENFRYITIRSIIIRMMFIISVFLFVREQHDYIIYYSLFVGITVLNAICNWVHKKSIVSFHIKSINLKRYYKPFIILGIFALLSAIYTKLSMPVLSFSCGDEEAGYYATATRMYQVIIALISSLISAIIPRMSILVKENKTEEIKKLTNMAFCLLFFIALPVIIFVEFFAKDIIYIFAGSGFEKAIIPMRIVMIQVLIIGTEQIFILQLLIPSKRDKAVVLSGLCGVIIWIFSSIIIVPIYHSVGTATVWIIAEFTVLCVASREVRKVLKIKFPWKTLGKTCILSIPYIIFGFIIMNMTDSITIHISCSIIIFSLYALYQWLKIKDCIYQEK